MNSIIKLWSRLVMFAVIIALLTTLPTNCSSCTSLDNFLNDLMNPSESVKGKEYISNKEIQNAWPDEFGKLITIKLTEYNIQFTEIDKTNNVIQQELTPIDLLIEEYKNEVHKQKNYCKNAKIEQATLLKWISENNSKIEYIKKKYEELSNKNNQIKKEIDKLISNLKSLKDAIGNNRYKKRADSSDQDEEVFFGNFITKEEYESIKKERKEQIEKLLREKIDPLVMEIKANTKTISNLNNRIDECVRQIERMNKELERIIIIKEDDDKTTDKEKDEDKVYYYIIGDEEELKSKGVVTSNNLYAGTKVNTKLDKNLFALLTQSDRSILLGGENDIFDIVSDNPEDSYEIKNINKTKVLVIKDVKRFWSNTEFLVIKKRAK